MMSLYIYKYNMKMSLFLYSIQISEKQSCLAKHNLATTQPPAPIKALSITFVLFYWLLLLMMFYSNVTVCDLIFHSLICLSK